MREPKNHLHLYTIVPFWMVFHRVDPLKRVNMPLLYHDYKHMWS